MKHISILGSTGSIGTSTLEVVRKEPGRFKVSAIAAGLNTSLVAEQAEEFRPGFVSVLTEVAAADVRSRVSYPVEVGWGEAGAVRAASFDGVEMTVAAISGAAGLVPTLAAIRAGKDIALANKETLVCAGPLVMDEVRRAGVKLMPVDSEHSAVFQSLAGHNTADVERIILTASGGPFLDTPLADFTSITPEMALNHPRWSMGPKVTVDSATMMNKGLEVIEAHWLFGVPAEKISVVVHPQSIVHSLVEYTDGAIVAQMSSTDMRGPIAYALSWPERVDSGAARLRLAGLTLDFREPDPARYPCLSLAYGALEAGGTMPAVLNAADEVAVEMFLKGAMPFADITRVVSAVMDSTESKAIDSLETVLAEDARARAKAAELIKTMI